jgi:type I restriction enzyme S subunit
MMRMWQGAVGVVPLDGLVSPAYIVARPHSEAESRYFAYLFRTADYMREVETYSRGIVPDRNRLYWESFKQLTSPVPPKDEQRLMVRFLDAHGALTNRLIRAKQRIIKLLEEQKQAITHRAVTRGLDPNLRLKPSGIPWLGGVPEGWDVKRLKTEMRFIGGGTPSKAVVSYWNGNIPWVSPKDMKSEVVDDAEDKITMEAVEKSSTKIVPSGSVLMVVRSGILQRTIPIALCSRDVAIKSRHESVDIKRKNFAWIFCSVCARMRANATCRVDETRRDSGEH